ncbi:MAG: hypothetical protein J6T70_15110 [Bacteroidales bacterium]|nr:hypothetical protein [Bacteroidales bacterium]
MKKSYVFTIVALLALVICGLYFNDTYIKWTKGNAESENDSNTVSTKVKEPTIANDTIQPTDSVQTAEQANNSGKTSKTEGGKKDNSAQSSSIVIDPTQEGHDNIQDIKAQKSSNSQSPNNIEIKPTQKGDHNTQNLEFSY